MLGKVDGRRRRGRQRVRWLDDTTSSMDMNLNKLREVVKDRKTGALQSMGSKRVRHDLAAEQQQQKLQWFSGHLHGGCQIVAGTGVTCSLTHPHDWYLALEDSKSGGPLGSTLYFNMISTHGPSIVSCAKQPDFLHCGSVLQGHEPCGRASGKVYSLFLPGLRNHSMSFPPLPIQWK